MDKCFPCEDTRTKGSFPAFNGKIQRSCAVLSATCKIQTRARIALSASPEYASGECSLRGTQTDSNVPGKRFQVSGEPPYVNVQGRGNLGHFFLL
jgi:hypothetical protein